MTRDEIIKEFEIFISNLPALGLKRLQHVPQAVLALLKEQPCWIKCAALRTEDGRIFEGRSHADCYQAMKDAGVPRIPDARNCDQGFVTSEGEFVDRYRAAEVALEAGQTKKLESPLFSEDLTGDWPWKKEQPCKRCGGSGIVKQQEDGGVAELFCDCPAGEEKLEAFLKKNPDCRPDCQEKKESTDAKIQET